MRRSRRSAQQANGRRGQGSQPGRGAQSARGQHLPERVFWGDPQAETPPAAKIRPAGEPAAVVRSLGPPPLGAHDKVAEHYFVAVYDKAVGLASALAAAGGLLDDGEDQEA